MALAETILFAIFLCILLFCYCHWRWNIKNSRPITNWPLVGMLPGILTNVSRIHDLATDVLRKGGYTVVVKGPWFSNMNIIATSDPENFHYVYSTNYANYQRGPAFGEIFDVLGDGILIAESDSWKVQRKFIHSLFKENKFQRFEEKIAWEKVEKGLFPILEHNLKTQEIMDMQDLLHRFTFDLTCILLFDFDPNSLSLSLPHIPIATAMDEIEEALLQRHVLPQSIWKLLRLLQIGKEKKVTSGMKAVDGFIYHHISSKRELKKSKTTKNEVEVEKGYDLVTNFIEKEEENEQIGGFEISNKFLRDLILSLLVAGRDTSSVALTWFFWLVTTNPSVENKIREEIKTHLKLRDGEKWRFFNQEELSKLVYLHATLCETLRLYPPVPFNDKAAVKPDILPSGHRVERNTKILFSMYAMGRMEKIRGADCMEFKPERWISEQGKLLHFTSYKFVAFGAGPRTCAGKDLAFLKMKTVAAAVLWNYRIQMVEGHIVSPSSSVILCMEHGFKIKVEKRYE